MMRPLSFCPTANGMAPAICHRGLGAPPRQSAREGNLLRPYYWTAHKWVPIRVDNACVCRRHFEFWVVRDPETNDEDGFVMV